MTKTIISALSGFLTYGEGESAYRLPVGDLPPAVQVSLMQRAFSHIMGNEAAAVKTRMAAAKDEAGDAKYNDAEIATALHDWRLEKMENMLSGVFSVRAVGPRLTSDEKILREFAKNSIVKAAEAKGKTLPKASDTEAWDKAIDQYLSIPALRALADAEVARRKAAPVQEVDIDALLSA